jgi:hypothetical protein
MEVAVMKIYMIAMFHRETGEERGLLCYEENGEGDIVAFTTREVAQQLIDDECPPFIRAEVVEVDTELSKSGVSKH